MLKENSIDIDKYAPANGTTPLITAAGRANLEVVAFLIAQGADIDKKDAANMTALLWACGPGGFQLSKVKVINLLLKNGASPNTKGLGGGTALMTSVHWNNFPGVKALLQYGANVNIINNDDQTALDRAQEKLKSRLSPDKKEKVNKIINILKEHGAKTSMELKK